MTATYLIDGVPLDDPAGRWTLNDATRLPAAAVPRVSRLDLPYRDGVIAARQGWAEGHVRLALDLAADDGPHKRAGNYDLSPLDGYRSMLSALIAGGRKLTWRPRLGAPSRTTEIIEADIAEMNRVTDWGVLIASLTVQPFWAEDSAPVTAAVQPVGTGVVFAEFAGSTARLADAIVRVTGPISALAITDQVTKTGITYAPALPAGSRLYYDTASGRAWTSTSTTMWTPGASKADVDWPMHGPLQVWPAPQGPDLAQMAPRLAFSGANTSSATGLTIRARRHFL